MNVRGVLLLAAMSGAALLSFASSSCSAPDPGFIEYRERLGFTPSASSGGPVGDGGGGDGGSSSGDPVFGTSTFTAGTAPPTGVSNGQPGRANVASATHPGQNVVGATCHATGCHGPGQPGPDWAMAGTVYNSVGGGAGVAGVEVRIAKPDGTEYAKTFTDQDGNFWIDKPVAGDVPANSRSGVRNAASKFTMMAVVSGNAGSACTTATCHGMATQRIYLQ